MNQATSSTSTHAPETHQASRWKKGIVAGIAATVAMSVLMIIGMTTGIAPMPQPIPVALVATTLGPGLPQPALMALGIVAHLAYGGFWGGLLAWWRPHPTLMHGIALGVFLWILMQIAVLPYLGWGLFGSAVTVRIAAATLLLHLVYGGTLGWLLSRWDDRGEE